ncbi:tryptophan-rich sensory protein [Candidatus Micrarchaeota archaeon]|nr:tryptophan-rich sensory protein [Candidatus Micrarchaeota archaeon]
MKLKNAGILIGFIILCLLAGIIGSIFTTQNIPTWYESINKPSFNPPNWVFGPVWTILYVLMGISAYLIYSKGIKKKEVKLALIIFGIQLVLNTLWSILFFGLTSPLFGLICIIFLWLFIVLIMKLFYKLDKKAAYLLIPYILWVSFATILNYYIFILN